MKVSPLDIIIDDGFDDDYLDDRHPWWPEAAAEQDITVTSTIELLVKRRVICVESGD